LTRTRRIWRPPAHWRLLSFFLFIIAILILFQGIATHTIGTTAEPHNVRERRRLPAAGRSSPSSTATWCHVSRRRGAESL
jgi:hypothetical protein